jgi:hypothetical protein
MTNDILRDARRFTRLSRDLLSALEKEKPDKDVLTRLVRDSERVLASLKSEIIDFQVLVDAARALTSPAIVLRGRGAGQ